MEDLTSGAEPTKNTRRAVLAGSVVGLLGLAGGGLALAQSGLLGNRPVNGTDQDLKKQPGPQPASAPASGGPTRDADPLKEQVHAIVMAGVAELATKLGKSGPEITAAAHAVSDTRPSEAEMRRYQSSSASDQAKLRQQVAARWLEALATELEVDRAVLVSAINEVKDHQLTAKATEIAAIVDELVRRGDVSRDEATQLLRVLKEEKIGG